MLSYFYYCLQLCLLINSRKDKFGTLEQTKNRKMKFSDYSQKTVFVHSSHAAFYTGNKTVT